MQSDSYERAKKSNYKEEELWKVKKRQLEREEDSTRKFHIFNIEKVKNTKWKSLEQIKRTMQKENKKQIGKEGIQMLINESDSDDSYVSPFNRKARQIKKVEMKDWNEYAYEKYQSMLVELDTTLKLGNEKEYTIQIEEDTYHMPIPKIIIHPCTESEDSSIDERIQIRVKKKKERKSRARNSDFGRIKYLKNLKQVKSIKFTNKYE